MELIGLDPQEMRHRYPAQLSGGQRQRVGVARALAADPPLMLMDEPFGAIDPINRARLQDEFLALQAKVKKTVVFVTHDIDEAIKMGDRIAILREGGRLAQYDTPREILIHPADDFVAEFVGADRSIKRLSLTTLGELKLLEPNGTRPGPTRAPLQTSVRDALSMILTAGGEALTVVDGEDRVQGLLTLGLIEQLLSEEAAANGNGDGSPSISSWSRRSTAARPALPRPRLHPRPRRRKRAPRTGRARHDDRHAAAGGDGPGDPELQRAQQQVRGAEPLLLHGMDQPQLVQRAVAGADAST